MQQIAVPTTEGIKVKEGRRGERGSEDGRKQWAAQKLPHSNTDTGTHQGRMGRAMRYKRRPYSIEVSNLDACLPAALDSLGEEAEDEGKSSRLALRQLNVAMSASFGTLPRSLASVSATSTRRTVSATW